MKKILLMLLLGVFISQPFAKNNVIEIENYKEFKNFIDIEIKNNTEMQKVIYINDITNGIINADNNEKHKDTNEILKSRIANYEDISNLKYQAIIDAGINENKLKNINLSIKI